MSTIPTQIRRMEPRPGRCENGATTLHVACLVVKLTRFLSPLISVLLGCKSLAELLWSLNLTFIAIASSLEIDLIVLNQADVLGQADIVFGQYSQRLRPKDIFCESGLITIFHELHKVFTGCFKSVSGVQFFVGGIDCWID